jgi:hypothetical protein
MPPLPDRAAVAPLPPILASPALAEAERARLGHELENYLAPLVTYCDVLPANEHLSQAEFLHGYEVRQALDAFVRYETQTELLLTKLRAALAYAQQQARAQVPSLEAALGLPASPSDL